MLVTCTNRKNRIGVVVVLNLSRLDRQTHDHVSIKALLKKPGPTVVRLVFDDSDGQTLETQAQQVAAAITALPEHQRVAILLRYYQDLSLAEIAQTLNIPIGTVKSRLSLGLQRLRTWLE